MAKENNNQFKKQYSSLKFSRYLFIFLMFMLVVLVFWIIVSLFSSQNKLKITSDLKTMVIPLSPNIDTDTLGRLESKKEYKKEELEVFPIYKVEVDPETQEKSLVEVDLGNSDKPEKFEQEVKEEAMQTTGSESNSQESSGDSMQEGGTTGF
ncbi:MAG: hypothetical protein PVJ09_02480 [Candidatus Woesebacteria bacterium]|jgi:hypothetical protein